MASQLIRDAWAAQQADIQRSQRMFVSAAGSDQTYAGTDAFAVNPAGQFVARGPAGTAIEGKPVSQAQQQLGMKSNLKRFAIPALLLLLLLRR